MTKSLSKHARDNRANQLNQTHPAYHSSRGGSVIESPQKAAEAQAEADPSVGPRKPDGSAAQQGSNEPSG